MATTIQISENLKKKLQMRKFFNKESYEEVIWDLIEDSMELNEQTKKEIEKARNEIKAGKFYRLDQVKKELRL
jgi:predicted transcriptional regulator